jgi:SAM-dependent methyltransferase
MTNQHPAPPPAHAHAHAHGHGGGGDDDDWAAMTAHLELGGEISLPYLAQAAAWLRSLLKESSAGEVWRVLDVGSGPGVATCLLAETFPTAEVVAVDGSGHLLERARQRAAEAGLNGGDGDRIRTLEVDLPEDFGKLGRADLIWTSRTVHHLGDQQGALDRLAEALSDGGLLAVAEGGLPMRFLPRDIGIGRPGLGDRLEAANQERFTTMRAELPHSTAVVEDWPAMLRAAGLVFTGSRTFLTDLPAPLDDRARDYLHAHLSRTREMLADALAADDRHTLDVLLDDGSPASIRRRPDAFCLSATTVHTAARPVR